MYKVDKFLKATVPLDQHMALLAVLLHVCIMARVLADVMLVPSLAKKLLLLATFLAQGVVWALMLFGSIRYLALLSSYEMLTEMAGMLLVPCLMALFLAATIAYMFLFEAAARTVWKAVVRRTARLARQQWAVADAEECDAPDVAAEEAGSVKDAIRNCVDLAEEEAVEEGAGAEDMDGSGSGNVALAVRMALFAAIHSFKDECIHCYDVVKDAVVGPWAGQPATGGEAAEAEAEAEAEADVSDAAADADQAATSCDTEDAVVQEESVDQEPVGSSLAAEAAHAWGRVTEAARAAFGAGTSQKQASAVWARWVWVAWCLLAVAVLAVALLYGAWDVHVSCGYCAHQEYGVKNTKYERRTDPPYVCAEHTVCHSYIVLPEDGSTSMAVVFHASEPPAAVASLSVWRVPEAQAGLWGSCDGAAACAVAGQGTVEAEEGDEWQVPCASLAVDMEVARYVHHCALTELASATVYMYTPSYVAADGVLVQGEPHFFRTLPAEEQAFTFVVGGDLALDTNATNGMADMAAAEMPWFVGIGGDLTYDNGLMACYFRWDSMVNLVEEHLLIPTTLRTSSSPLFLQVPVVLVIGNHESGGYNIPIEAAPPYLWDYFPHRISLIQSLTPDSLAAPVAIQHLDLSLRGAEAYHAHVLGPSASLLALDTMQVTSMEPGEPQQLFMEESLESMQQRKWKFSMHHVPLYPSSFASPKGEVLRAFWEDLFIDGGLDVAFEHHEHSYKRNHLVAREELTSEGILYLGGGAWGVKAFLKDRDFSYLHKRMKLRYVWQAIREPAVQQLTWSRNYLLVTVTEERVVVLAKGEDGSTIDAVAMERDAGSRTKVLHELCGESVVCTEPA